ncbi:MAG: histidine kinase [Acidobacteriaceae bacterium]
MPITPSMKYRIALALWIFLLGTVAAAVFAIQWRTYASFHGQQVFPWDHYVRGGVEFWYSWTALTPLVLWLAAKHPILPRRIWVSLPLYLAASVVVVAIAIYLQAVLTHFLDADHWSIRRYVRLYLTQEVAIDIGIYWAVIGFAQVLSYHREAGKRELREARLEKQLAQAQLQVLQMQLHPHFLFNTLHAIGALIQENPAAAEQMLLDLSSLLRVFLEGQSSQEITLQRELHLVDLYMGIQQTRFQDRLTVRSRVDPETHDCLVPSLLLQPIIENAIVHGIATNPGEDTVEICVRLEDRLLVLEISNHNSVLAKNVDADGAGFGVGLSNTRLRLAQMYNDSAALFIADRYPRGVVCSITMPAVKTSSAPSAKEALLSL